MLDGGGTAQLEFDTGSLTVKTLYGHQSAISGTGVIHANGLVGSGLDFVFDGAGVNTWSGQITNGGMDAVDVNLLANGQAQMGGNLHVRNGARPYFRDAYFGLYGVNETVVVEGVGSQLYVSTHLRVGGNNSGLLQISDGATVRSYYSLDVDSSAGSVELDDGHITTINFNADAASVSGTGSVMANAVRGEGYRMLFDGAGDHR